MRVYFAVWGVCVQDYLYVYMCTIQYINCLVFLMCIAQELAIFKLVITRKHCSSQHSLESAYIDQYTYLFSNAQWFRQWANIYICSWHQSRWQKVYAWIIMIARLQFIQIHQYIYTYSFITSQHTPHHMSVILYTVDTESYTFINHWLTLTEHAPLILVAAWN